VGMGQEFAQMTKEDIAKIAQMGEQIQGLRDDVGEIKVNMRQDNGQIMQSISNFTTVVEKQTELYVGSIREIADRHYTKDEIQLMIQTRNTQEENQDKEIGRLSKASESYGRRLEKLEKKWAWLAGVGAALMTVLGIGEVALRVWGKG
jgi:seryl-tRNA synthetase